MKTISAFVRFVLVKICRFPLPLGVWEGLRFVIVALPELFSYLFCNYKIWSGPKKINRTTNVLATIYSNKQIRTARGSLGKITLFPTLCTNSNLKFFLFAEKGALAVAECQGDFDTGARWVNVQFRDVCKTSPDISESESTSDLRNLSMVCFLYLVSIHPSANLTYLVICPPTSKDLKSSTPKLQLSSVIHFRIYFFFITANVIAVWRP